MNRKLFFLLMFQIWTIALWGQSPCPTNENLPTILQTDERRAFPPVVPENSPPEDPEGEYEFERLAYFVHGLGGNRDSWGRVAPLVQSNLYPGFPARRLIALKPEYSQFDLYGAALELGNSMVSLGFPHLHPNAPKGGNIVIAHSQGGIVSRALDHLYTQNNSTRWFGGIASFGSPHGGARIANNYTQLYSLAEDACNSLTIGPVTEEIESNFWLDLLPLPLATGLVNYVCEFVGHDLLPVVASDFALPILDDYKVGAAAIEQLNDFESSTPLVSFYGVEEEPVFWRVLYNLGDSLPNEFEPFQANGEQDFLEEVDDVTNHYYNKYQHYFHETQEYERKLRDWGDNMFVGALFLAFHNNRYQEVKGIRDNYIKGFNWLTAADTHFRLITGAAEFLTGNTMVCFCEEGFADQTTIVPCADVSNFENCGRRIETAEYMAEYESDGIVTTNSATSVPGAINVKLEHANHQQLLNSAQTREALDGLLNGYYHPFFKTELR